MNSLGLFPLTTNQIAIPILSGDYHYYIITINHYYIITINHQIHQGTQ